MLAELLWNSHRDSLMGGGLLSGSRRLLNRDCIYLSKPPSGYEIRFFPLLAIWVLDRLFLALALRLLFSSVSFSHLTLTHKHSPGNQRFVDLTSADRTAETEMVSVGSGGKMSPPTIPRAPHIGIGRYTLVKWTVVIPVRPGIPAEDLRSTAEWGRKTCLE